MANTVRAGGRALVPVWSLGRAQELLLILEEYWRNHPEIQSIPIYYASRLAYQALKVFRVRSNHCSGQRGAEQCGTRAERASSCVVERMGG